MTGSLRAFAVGCGTALVAAAVLGCASAPRVPRDETFRAAVDRDLGYHGRALVVNMGQDSPVRLLPGSVRLDGGFLFVEETNHRHDALGHADLHLAWSYDGFREAVKFPPTLSMVSFLAMTDDELHEVNLEYGHATGPAIHFDMGPSAPFVATVGTAFVPTWGGGHGEKTLRTLNLATGLEGWGWRTPGDIRGAMAIGGTPPRQTVYFATDAGEVYALPAREASAPAPEPNWVQKTHGRVTAGLTLSGEDLFVASQDGFLYSLDRVTGGIRWSAPHETPLLAVPVATASAVYQARTGELWCHDRATGRVRWKVAGAARFVVEREGKSVVQMKDSSLAAVDATGRVTGNMAPGGYTYPTNTADDAIFAVAADGFIIKLERGGE